MQTQTFKDGRLVGAAHPRRPRDDHREPMAYEGPGRDGAARGIVLVWGLLALMVKSPALKTQGCGRITQGSFCDPEGEDADA